MSACKCDDHDGTFKFRARLPQVTPYRRLAARFTAGLLLVRGGAWQRRVTRSL